jgi:DNA-directed RNA polymerase subunit RPC12/RpoP
MMARVTRICSRCGATAKCAEGGVPPGWSIETERRRVVYLCLACARANIRAIEGRLSEEYWE